MLVVSRYFFFIFIRWFSLGRGPSLVLYATYTHSLLGWVVHWVMALQCESEYFRVKPHRQSAGLQEPTLLRTSQLPSGRKITNREISIRWERQFSHKWSKIELWTAKLLQKKKGFASEMSASSILIAARIIGSCHLSALGRGSDTSPFWHPRPTPTPFWNITYPLVKPLVYCNL